MYLTLERAGVFRASSMIDTTTKCGAMGMTEYNYRVRIQASTRKLTPEGYILNNEDVQNFFDVCFGEKAKPWMAYSCENMAKVACEGLASVLITKRIRIRFLAVTLEGSNGALITAEWETSLLTPLINFLRSKNPFAIVQYTKPQADEYVLSHLKNEKGDE